MFKTGKFVSALMALSVGVSPVYFDRIVAGSPTSFSHSDLDRTAIAEIYLELAARDQRGGRGDCNWLGC